MKPELFERLLFNCYNNIYFVIVVRTAEPKPLFRYGKNVPLHNIIKKKKVGDYS